MGKLSDGGEPHIERGRTAAASKCMSDEACAGVAMGESDADDGAESSVGNEEGVPMTLSEPKWENGIGIASVRLPVTAAGV